MGIGDFGAVLGGYDQQMAILQKRREEQMMQELTRRQIQQQMQGGALDIQLKQQLMGRDRDAARMTIGAMGGGQGQGMPPQQMPYPGAQQMPQFNQNNGAAVMPPRQPGMGALPPGTMGRMSGGANVQRPSFGNAQAQVGAASGGGVSLHDFVARIRAQNPNADELTIMQAIQNYLPLLKTEDQERFRDITSSISLLRAETAEARAAGAGGGGAASAATTSREIDMKALSLGIDTTTMKSDNEKRKAIAAAEGKLATDKAGKETAPQKRAGEAKKSTRELVGQIEQLVSANPNAVNIWGSAATRQSEFLGTFGVGKPDETDPDAMAAEQLETLMTKLSHEAGIADAEGGVGGSSFSKDYAKLLDKRALIRTPDLLMSKLKAMIGETGEVAVKPKSTINQGWSDFKVVDPSASVP